MKCNLNNTNFGPHLMLDLYNCNKHKLSDYNFIFNLLNEIPELIGMHKITQPYCFPYSGLVPEDKGITGIVILAESHCSIHSFDMKDFVFIDIFSCKNFDVDFTTKYFINAFEAKSCDCSLADRGLNFPR